MISSTWIFREYTNQRWKGFILKHSLNILDFQPGTARTSASAEMCRPREGTETLTHSAEGFLARSVESSPMLSERAMDWTCNRDWCSGEITKLTHAHMDGREDDAGKKRRSFWWGIVHISEILGRTGGNCLTNYESKSKIKSNHQTANTEFIFQSRNTKQFVFYHR